MPTYVFDIDGVIFDVSKRLEIAKQCSRGDEREFWRYFFQEELLIYDIPRRIGIELLMDRLDRGRVVIVTGRPNRLRRATLDQLSSAGIPVNRISEIYMRRDNDYRKGYIVKEEIIKYLLSRGMDIEEIHDDDEIFLKRIKTLLSCKLYLHRDSEVIELFPYSKRL
ncbi:HAD superfamily phosphatase [Ignisphaera aggregans DSM 17230]|uniref:HAD superfamily phosphatase n=1 Tax=Ignisphaera aggregans (strain DSM 17230 / JCM 13409 / AQ1.S1) TaxID=583356 RepID=E0ST60_IGNAA|nr:HAD superfamily phosphatase [Ignisphaera aggregans DSM 17230]